MKPLTLNHFAMLALALASVLPLSAQSQTLPPPQAPAPWSEVAPSVSIGHIQRITTLNSRYVDSRPIDVWLPPGYSPSKRYAVLYMHDGQMLFDASQTWNKKAWNVHQTLAKLIAAGKVRDTIVVGIPNDGKYRFSEYYPAKMLARLPDAARQKQFTIDLAGWSLSDAYLRFVVEEVKPLIDQRFATLPDRDNTFLMGSSMGGLISVYAICEYPEVFGGAAALSTHWPGVAPAARRPEDLLNATLPLAAFTYLQATLPKAANHRLYMDHGDVGLDASYQTDQRFVDQIVTEQGYTASNFVSRVFAGASHTEDDWSARLDVPLLFLLGK